MTHDPYNDYTPGQQAQTNYPETIRRYIGHHNVKLISAGHKESERVGPDEGCIVNWVNIEIVESTNNEIALGVEYAIAIKLTGGKRALGYRLQSAVSLAAAAMGADQNTLTGPQAKAFFQDPEKYLGSKFRISIMESKKLNSEGVPYINEQFGACFEPRETPVNDDDCPF